jgi:hypothetical protein
MQQPPNPYPQYPQQPSPQQWQQQPNYTQPQSYQQQPARSPQQQWQQQPPFPPQQYQQPPQYQPPMPPPKKNLRKRLWLLVAAIFVIAVILGVASRGQNQQPTPTTQATQQPATQATQQPTAQTQARQTPVVSIQSQLQSAVQTSGAKYDGDATVSYDADAKYAHIFENFPVTGDNNLDVSRIKQDAFAIQRAIWQAHVSGVDAVQIIFNSDDATPLRIATCELERTTAAKLKWASITTDQAWSDYDAAWLSPSL